MTLRSLRRWTAAAAVTSALFLGGFGYMAVADDTAKPGKPAAENAAPEAKPKKGKKAGAERAKAGNHGKGEGHFGRGPAGPEADHFPFWNNERIATKLELTEEQIKQLETAHEGTKSALDAVRDSTEELHEQLRAEFEKDAPSVDVINGIAEKLGKAHGDMLKATFTHRLAVESILTEEQAEELKEIRHNMLRRQGGPGAWGGRGELRERIKGMSPEELEEAMERRGVPEGMRERIRNRAGEAEGEEGMVPPPRRPRGPMPPLPPEGDGGI